MDRPGGRKLGPAGAWRARGSTIGRRRVVGGLAAAMVAGCQAPSGPAWRHDPFRPPAPGAWERWRPAGRRSLDIDHGAWEALLATHARTRSDRVRLFAYGEVTLVEQETLDDYIRSLTTVPVTALDRREQLAFWLNLHNALLLRVVVRGYLVMSVRDLDLGGGPLAAGPWSRKLVDVDGEPVSLDDIRHRILRPIFRDPRVHYGLANAAVGGPDLPVRAFTGATIDRHLDELAIAYVNHPRGVRFERGGQVLSSLYDWYETDFGGGLEGVVAHLRLYLGPPLAAVVSPRWPTRYQFDWSLDDATGLPR